STRAISKRSRRPWKPRARFSKSTKMASERSPSVTRGSSVAMGRENSDAGLDVRALPRRSFQLLAQLAHLVIVTVSGAVVPGLADRHETVDLLAAVGPGQVVAATKADAIAVELDRATLRLDGVVADAFDGQLEPLRRQGRMNPEPGERLA